MRAMIQRISEGRVTIDGQVVAECDGKGLLVLLGVTHGDTEAEAEALAEKIAKTRIFSDENDKMNLSVTDVDGGILVVSNFTLYASYRKGNRPDYMDSAPPSLAEPLYEYFISRLRAMTPKVGCGVFGADMKVSITNDGPVTFQMDSDILKQPKK